MRGSKTAAKMLRKARLLMNDGGKHWHQGALQGPFAEDDKPTYCYAGGIQAAIYGGLADATTHNRWAKASYVEAVIASARAIGYATFRNAEKKYERALTSEVFANRMLKPYTEPPVGYPEGYPVNTGVKTLRQAFAAEVEVDIFRFNDRLGRKWSDVDAMLEKAAASLEAEEEHGLGAI